MEQRSTLAQHNPAGAFEMHKNQSFFIYHMSYDHGRTPRPQGQYFSPVMAGQDVVSSVDMKTTMADMAMATMDTRDN